MPIIILLIAIVIIKTTMNAIIMSFIKIKISLKLKMLK